MRTPAAAGYSGRPLHEKLGFKPGSCVLFIALPADLEALATAVDFGACVRARRWSAVRAVARFDAIHAFTTDAAEIAAHLGRLERAVRRDGMIWVSWPKKAAKRATDVSEDVIRAAALGRDLVDVKVAAVDAVWSGLKLVIRKERR